MRVYRSDARWQEREKDIRADAVIVSMSPPSYPSVWLHPCRARCSSTWLNHCTSHRDRRSDFEQPAGVRIGAVGVGSPCGYGGHGRSCPGRERNALDSARSRSWSATSKSTTSRLVGYGQISLSYPLNIAWFERSPTRRGKRLLAVPSA
jgi:hypothetical protein